MPSYINQLLVVGGNTTNFGVTTNSSNPEYGLYYNATQEPCQSSLNFFSKLSDKLLTMVKSLKKQFDECKNAITTRAKGFILAEVEVKTAPLNVKYEYVEYIKRYGPPTNGIFEEEKLILLRKELGISTATSL